MNKRQWKKACYKAGLKLTRLYPNEYELSYAAGSELVAAPAAFLSHHHGTKVLGIYVFAPRGMLLARRKSQASPEEEQCRTALEILTAAQHQGFSEQSLRNDLQEKDILSGCIFAPA